MGLVIIAIINANLAQIWGGPEWKSVSNWTGLYVLVALDIVDCAPVDINTKGFAGQFETSGWWCVDQRDYA